MANGTPMPFVKAQWFDSNGDPLAGYKLFTYAAGTTTKLATYSDADLTIANTNPIILDSAGRANVFLSAATYKFVMAPPTDTDPPTVPLWTVDDVSAIPSFSVDLDITGTAGEDVATGEAVYLSAGDGGKTAGRWYLASSSNSYSSLTALATGMVPSDIATGMAGTIRRVGRVTGLSALTTGSVYYIDSTGGAITLTPPTLARRIGVADSTTSLVLSETPQYLYGVPLAYIAPGGAAGAFVPATIYKNYTTVGNVGAGEDTLMAIAIPAGILASNGQSIRVLGWGKTANNANGKTVKGHFGVTPVLGGSGAVLAVSEAGSWMCGFQVMRDSATTQRAVAQLTCGPAGSPATASAGAVTNPGETLSGAIVVKFTAIGTSDNDITQEGMVITYHP